MSTSGTYDCRRRETCRICGGEDLFPYLDLGDQPPANGFIAPAEIAGEQRFPLEVALADGFPVLARWYDENAEHAPENTIGKENG